MRGTKGAPKEEEEMTTTEQLELTLKLGGIAVLFDGHRLDAVRLQRARNDIAECDTPGYGAQPGWRTKPWIYADRDYCDLCKERQKFHNAMTAARSQRGAELRRLHHWAEKLRALTNGVEG